MINDEVEKDENKLNIKKEILKYEAFVNEKLRNDLKLNQDQQEGIFIQLNNYNEVKAFINEMKCKSFGDGCLKTQVDIGSNFYLRCTIPADEKIILFAGLGFYIEFSLEEALLFIDKRCVLLKNSLNRLFQQSCEIKAQIKLMLDTLRQLQGISENVPE